MRPDQPLVEVETDKAVVEIPAPRAGTILRLAVGEGEKIQVGEVLVVIGEAGERQVTPPSLPSSPGSVGLGLGGRFARYGDHRAATPS